MSVYVMYFKVAPSYGERSYWLVKIGQTSKTATERMWSLLNSVTFSGMECLCWFLRDWEPNCNDDDGLEAQCLRDAAYAVEHGVLERVPTRREWFRFTKNGYHPPHADFTDTSCYVNENTGEFCPDGWAGEEEDDGTDQVAQA